MQKGVFICIEGLDGSGKTTQAKLLTRRLQATHRVVYTAEPSQGKIGSFIRESCLYSGKRISSVAEALLFAADRVEHVQNEILPALNEGRLVISDRYVFSSLAYQGAGGLSLNWIERINEQALPPDLALFIDADPESVMRRLKPRRSVMENFATQKKVQKIYLEFVAKGKLVRIDGNRPKNVVAEDIFATVMKFLETPKPR